jgi:hypothetical protein
VEVDASRRLAWGRNLKGMSNDASYPAREALHGAWGAAAAAMRYDWDGFEILIADGVHTKREACAWAMAALGGVAVLLRHCDVSAEAWGLALSHISVGEHAKAIVLLNEQILEQGAGGVVGRTVGQLAAAVSMTAAQLGEDPEELIQRLCLDVHGF